MLMWPILYQLNYLIDPIFVVLREGLTLHCHWTGIHYVSLTGLEPVTSASQMLRCLFFQMGSYCSDQTGLKLKIYYCFYLLRAEIIGMCSLPGSIHDLKTTVLFCSPHYVYDFVPWGGGFHTLLYTVLGETLV